MNITITHNPKLGLFLASVPRFEFRSIDYASDGKAANKDEAIAYSHTQKIAVQHVLASGNTAAIAGARAMEKLNGA